MFDRSIYDGLVFRLSRECQSFFRQLQVFLCQFPVLWHALAGEFLQRFAIGLDRIKQALRAVLALTERSKR